MNNSTLLIGVIFPGIESCFNDYLKSLNCQTDENFDTLIINDHLDIDISKIFNKKNTTIKNIEDDISPSTIRNIAIQYALDKEYEYLIFSDIDDYFDSKRIENTKKGLKSSDFVFNKLILVDNNKNIIKEDFFQPDCINNLIELLDKNLIGLGHSGVNVCCLKNIIIPNNIIAVDWYLYSILLLKNYSGILIDSTTTFYRQNSNNLVGGKSFLTEKRVSFGLQVKENHYNAMLDYCENNNYIYEHKYYKMVLNKILKLKEKLKENDFRNKYIDVINENIDQIYSGWWSEILTLNEWSNYV